MTNATRAKCLATIGGDGGGSSSSSKIIRFRVLPLLLVASLASLAFNSNVAQCQFLQPQSHLGRLVQSIASPLVLSGAYAGDSSDADDSPAGPYGAPGETSSGGQPGAAQHFQHYHREQQQPTRHHQFGQAAMQQAPSQERGVPQHFYGRDGVESQADEEDAGAPSSPHKQRAGPAGEEYRMGAYLGPTIDDKEIQGAFNSKDDERDEDDAAGYVGGPTSGRQRAASSPQDAGSYGGPSETSYGAGGMSAPSYPARGVSAESSASPFDDESGADEDDDSSPAAGRRGRGPDSSRFRTSGQAAAASHYHQQRRQHASNQRQQQQQQQMQAAANGYAPYGYPAAAGAAGNGGPIDLSSLMGAGPGGYDVYNGDGSYPGAGYYQQQGNGGRRNQAASSMMGAGPFGGPFGGPQQQQQQQAQRVGNADNDDQDADVDEDRA